MKRLSNKTLRIILPIFLLIIAIVLLIMPVEHKIKGPGRFIAAAEWTLVQIEQDKLQSNLFYNGVKRNDKIALFHFNRPDYINLTLAPNLQIGERVQSDAVAATLVSAEDAIRLSDLRGALAEAQANIAALNTGEKQALQLENQRAVAYAESQVAAHKLILDRQQELFKKQLISEQELDSSLAQYELLKINVELQKARLQSVKTGEKAEEIAAIQARMDATKAQLDAFSNKLEAETIRIPINGILVQPDRALGELCHVCSLDSVIMQMPIKASEAQYVKPGMTIQAFVSGSKNRMVSGEIQQVDHNALQVNGQPMFLATAKVANKDGDILNGMTGYMKINIGRVGGLTLLKRSWSNFHFNR